MIEDESEIVNFASIFDKLYNRRKIKPQWNSTSETFIYWYKILYFYKKAIWTGVYNDEEKMIGAILFINEGERLICQFGASDPDYRKFPISHLCIHEVIKYAKNNNFKYLDLGGYDMDATPSDQTYNINIFKKHFGGKLVSSYPNMNIALNKPLKLFMDFLLKIKGNVAKNNWQKNDASRNSID